MKISFNIIYYQSFKIFERINTLNKYYQLLLTNIDYEHFLSIID